MRDYGNIEIHVSDVCNRSCSFCVSKYEEGRGKIMSASTAVALRERLRGAGVRAITFSGGGEPTMNNGVLSYLIDNFASEGVRCGLTTNGYQTAGNECELEWVRLSVYSPTCMREITNVLATKAKVHNAALFYTGMENLKRYLFLLNHFDEVTVKTLNNAETPRLSDEEVQEILAMGFKCKQNAFRNDFAKCRFDKPCFDTEGKEHKCCLCKAAGGFVDVEHCTVPCVMYNSNKQRTLVLNKYGFSI